MFSSSGHLEQWEFVAARVKAQHFLGPSAAFIKSRMFASCQASIGINKPPPTDHLKKQKHRILNMHVYSWVLKLQGILNC